jgi:predicted metal-binding membrane protein
VGARQPGERRGPRGLTDARQAAVLAALAGVAVLGWVTAGDRMAGMDEGPGTDVGPLASYVSLWVVMIGAMMIPSAAPMVVVHSAVRRRRRSLGRGAGRGGSALFVGGYVSAWTAFGLVAYGLFELLRSLDVEALSWARDGRYAAAAVIAAAAAYQLSGLKDACLSKCRDPIGFVVASWRDGAAGAVRMGAEQGAWCAGCCWALMAVLFALGFMSIAWMAVVAGLIAAEKLLPSGRLAARAVALVLLVLAVSVAVAPATVPGLTIPGA